MVFCGTCGSKLVKGDRFCRGCGAPATGDVTPLERKSDGATDATEEPRVGGWAAPLFLFGIVGGFVGWLRLRDADRRRADHVLKWGAIWSAISWVGAPLLTLAVLLGFSLSLRGGSTATQTAEIGSATTAAVGTTAAVPSAAAAPVPADAVAVVGPETISIADLDAVLERTRRSYLTQKRAFPAPATPDYRQIEQSAITFLIQRAELNQEAEQLHITISPTQVEERVAQIKAQLGGEAAYEKQTTSNGLTEATVRSEIVTPALTSEAIYRRVTSGITLSDADVEAYSRAHPSTKRRSATRQDLLLSRKGARFSAWTQKMKASFASKIAFAPGYEWARS